METQVTEDQKKEYARWISEAWNEARFVGTRPGAEPSNPEDVRTAINVSLRAEGGVVVDFSTPVNTVVMLPFSMLSGKNEQEIKRLMVPAFRRLAKEADLAALHFQQTLWPKPGEQT